MHPTALTNDPSSMAVAHYHCVAFHQESDFGGSLCCCSLVFIELYAYPVFAMEEIIYA